LAEEIAERMLRTMNDAASRRRGRCSARQASPRSRRNAWTATSSTPTTSPPGA